MGLIDLLTNPAVSNLSFIELKDRILKLRRSGIYPYTGDLSQSISFTKDFWDDLVKIYKQTDIDGLERAFSIFWADEEVIFTKVKTGSNKMVKSGGTIQVKYSHHPTKRFYARKELYVDGRIIKKRDVYQAKVPKKLEVQYLFNIHTHPKHISKNGDVYYNFFSAQDIKSLISSKAIVTGLVTNKLWLLFRTSKSPSCVDSIVDAQMTPDYVVEKLHMGLYSASFNKRAYRYNLSLVQDN
jgi:hypothetical protein